MEPVLVIVYVTLIVLNIYFWTESYWLKWKATRFYTEEEYQALLKRKGLDRVTYSQRAGRLTTIDIGGTDGQEGPLLLRLP